MSARRTDTPERIPLLSLLLGYGPVLIILLAGVAFLFDRLWAVRFGQLWAAAILIFLAGVVRGLSFFTEGGPRMTQLLMMLLRFLCGIGGLIISPPFAFGILGLGYLSIPFYDARAARTGAAPRYFARLRPPQMAIALAGLVLLSIPAANGG
ncbi:DUF3429 domain-containing protein [Novosphingobium sp. M1R2S20]|uniref:DUF3429 domain-containing protein n=1 Tax=Novosphingobium rhizovicinum TaxID=3228928 RepID=A0ABV3R9D8_9SPHN